MSEAELAQALVTSGPAGVGVLVLAFLIKQWLGQLRSDVVRLGEKVAELEAAVQRGSVESAGHRASVVSKLEDLDRRVTSLEARGGGS
jgi:hypothetical protein